MKHQKSFKKIQKTEYYSYKLGALPKGCQYCVRGEKLVLFLTGLCPRHCFYCPLSERKYQKDVTFANERPVKTFKDIEVEARLMMAKGAGITGGDPLTRLNRTISYIKKLKQIFGKKFHVHLYTSLNLANKKNLKELHNAGLDEIRFHPDLDSSKLWPKLELARKLSWDMGVEVPLIPGKEKQLKKLIDFVQDKVNFLNLNELELADSPVSQLRKLGFTPKNRLSYAVKDSLGLGLKLLGYIQKKKYSFKTHLCTAKLKDAVQMAKRIKRESKQTKKAFDLVDPEGLLIRGALYLPDLLPSFSYREKIRIIKTADKTETIKKLSLLKNKIVRELRLNPSRIYLDKIKLRILLSHADLKKNKNYFKALNLKPALVKEYPTYDQLEVEVEFW